MKMNPQGDMLWAFQPGGNSYKSANGLAVTGGGTCFLAGWFRGTTAFGGYILTNKFISNRDMFIARVDGPASHPRLGLAHAGSNVVLSWPAAAGAQLQSATYVAP